MIDDSFQNQSKYYQVNATHSLDLPDDEDVF